MALSSTPKRIIINIVLLLAVSGLTWLVYQQLQEDKQGAETLYHKDIGESVEQITITLPDQTSIIMEANGANDAWSLVQPIAVAANKQALQQLFTLLGEPILTEYPVADKDLSTFGLDGAAISVSFNAVEYRLGKLNPVNHRRYVLLKDRILLVNEAVYELLMRGVDGFKEKG